MSRSHARAHNAVAALALTLLGACMHSLAPRTAEVVPRGKFALGYNFTAFTYGFGEFRYPGATSTANTGFRNYVHPLLYVLYGSVMNGEECLRYGVANHTELAGYAGPQEIGLEIRGALLDEDQGSPVGVAVSAAASWRPFMDLTVPFVRAGIDVSKPAGEVEPLVNLYVSYGPEAHAQRLPDSVAQGCEVSGAPGCSGLTGGQFNLAVRNELRIQAALGLAIHALHGPQSDPGPPHESITVGVVPYRVLAAGPPNFSCTGCTRPATGFDEQWGVSLVFGGSWEAP